MNLTKNLVITVSSLWTRCPIKNFICEHSHRCDSLPHNCGRNKWMPANVGKTKFFFQNLGVFIKHLLTCFYFYASFILYSSLKGTVMQIQKLIVSSQTYENNILKTQGKTMPFVSCLTVKFNLQTEKNNKKV